MKHDEQCSSRAGFFCSCRPEPATPKPPPETARVEAIAHDYAREIDREHPPETAPSHIRGCSCSSVRNSGGFFTSVYDESCAMHGRRVAPYLWPATPPVAEQPTMTSVAGAALKLLADLPADEALKVARALVIACEPESAVAEQPGRMTDEEFEDCAQGCGEGRRTQAVVAEARRARTAEDRLFTDALERDHELGKSRARVAELERERDEALSLAYIGEHRLPDHSWMSRAHELMARVKELAESARIHARGECDCPPGTTWLQRLSALSPETKTGKVGG